MSYLKCWDVYNAEDKQIDTIKTAPDGTLEQASAKLRFKYGTAATFLYLGKPYLFEMPNNGMQKAPSR